MMVSLGAIDKLAHMWGPEDTRTGPPGSIEEMRSLPFAAKTADAQVGRLIEALKARGILDETLVVVTADHASQTGRPFYGRLDTFPPGVPDSNLCDPASGSTGLRSDCNWYYGADADERYLDPSPAIAALRDALTPPGGVSNLRFSYQDGHIAVWLNDNSYGRELDAAAAILDLPGVIASFRLSTSQDEYRLFGTNPMSSAERRWFRRHGQKFVDAMAAPYAPDAVGLLQTDVTYGTMGDHGGHTRLTQNIPMVFSWPGLRSGVTPRKKIRLVDVVPTVLKTIGIDYDERDLDGRPVRLPRR
jgi:arylsulfatase A-like enzyme